MSIELKIPVLGEGVESGDVLEIFVKPGDTIAPDQGLIELETDKATVTVPAEQGGQVTQVHVTEGQTVKVGDPIVTIESASAGAPSGSEPKTEPTVEAPAEPAVPEPAAEPEATASSPPVPATGSNAPSPLDSSAPDPPTQPTPAATTSGGSGTQVATSAPPQSADAAAIPAGPAIRRLAREVGIDLATIQGTGENGRITREDVMSAVRGCAQRGTDRPTGQTDGFGPVRIEKMPRIRQTIARKMHESWTTAPRVTNFDDADVTSLEEIRQSSKKDYAAQGIKLTQMPFIIKSVAMALRSHPVVNASVDLEQGQVIYKEYVNIGIAVDTDRGLVVPSLRDADRLSIPEIARELGTMAEKVRNNDFSIEDLRGSTFSISNLGAIGGTYSTPIINIPETAILLVGRSRKMPVVVDDELKIRLMMPLSLSYDHRLIDGGAAARFLNDVIGYLEAPSRLLLAP